MTEGAGDADRDRRAAGGTVERALISVSDKRGIVDFARSLAAFGIAILSTGGTHRLLVEAGIAATEVSTHTGFAEMLDGRVKTLHPHIHGGLLARRDSPEHMAALATHGIARIDLLVVNLYPFEETVARPDCRFDDAIENIDIGGPALVRAAAKNHAAVTVLVEPRDYDRVLGQLRERGRVDDRTRFELAARAFAHTARYDGMIANWLGAHAPDDSREPFPTTLSLQFDRVQTLRYGENPHQSAAFYRERNAPAGTLADYRQLQGKALSYNNIADADTAWECVRRFDEPACVLVKHANPCGVAQAQDAVVAYRLAFATDPTSAFGGIIAFNRPVDAACAQAVCQQFVEVLIAPSVADDALAILGAKQNVRVLTIAPAPAVKSLDFKRVGGGLLVQDADDHVLAATQTRCVTRREPDAAVWADLMFAWRVAHFVKSNAIVFCRAGRTLGVGAGQMSRIDSARIATIKAQGASLDLRDSVVASDAFFPFRDGLDAVVDAGASAIIQPGGSQRDDEVITAANERGVAMVFTGVRHFRH